LDYGENIGRQEGQEGLDFFIDFVDERVEAGAHMIHNPIIDVNGDMATGRWYVDARESFGNGQTGLTTGEYHDTYQRVEGDWKFAKIEFTVHYQFVFDENHDLDKLRRRSPNN
jgi:hypothetical protein